MASSLPENIPLAPCLAARSVRPVRVWGSWIYAYCANRFGSLQHSCVGTGTERQRKRLSIPKVQHIAARRSTRSIEQYQPTARNVRRHSACTVASVFGSERRDVASDGTKH